MTAIAARAAPLEKVAQGALFDWLAVTRFRGEPIGKYAFAIPNGAHLFGSAGQRSMQIASLKKQGLRAGVPDVFIAIPIGVFHGMFIEMKRDKNSKVSEEQREWKTRLETKYYHAVIATGFDEAVRSIELYLDVLKR